MSRATVTLNFGTAALLTSWQINLALMWANCAAVADLAAAMRPIQLLSPSPRGVVRREDNVLHVAFTSMGPGNNSVVRLCSR